jgi:hypothetical protein
VKISDSALTGSEMMLGTGTRHDGDIRCGSSGPRADTAEALLS